MKKIYCIIGVVLCILVFTVSGCENLQKEQQTTGMKIDKMIIDKVELGGEHVSIIDDEGKMWSFGYNLYGQTGIDKNTITDVAVEKKTYIENAEQVMENVKMVKNGEWHTVILDRNGQIYSVGNNRYGQLGNRELSSLSPVIDNAKNVEYVPVESVGKVIEIEAGWMQSAYINANKDLYVWGNNEFGNLGIGQIGDLDEETRDCIVVSPTKCAKEIDAVSFGKEHTLILNELHEVYGAGANKYGQLGRNDIENTSTYEMILDNIRYIECGFWSSYAIDFEGNLWGWGDNRFKQIVDEEYEIVSEPIIIEKNVKKVVAGVNHVVILLETNECYVIGSNNLGQLGTTSKSNMMKNVEDIYSGDDIVFVKKLNGDIWGWGNNKNRVLSSTSERFIEQPICIYKEKR